MKKNLFFAMAISLAATMTGCDNYAKYTIDERPTVKPDRGLLGIWKPLGDKNPNNYVLIQDHMDLFNPTGKNILSANDAGEGKYSDYKSYNYYITQMEEKDGKPEFEEWTAFSSKINGAVFLNLSASGLQTADNDDMKERRSENEYFFVRLLSVNEEHTVFTVAMVGDTTLKNLKSSQQVRGYIAAHLNDASFYTDTARFYKVSNVHSSLKESMKIANPNRKY
jgi:hypothetical protein